MTYSVISAQKIDKRFGPRTILEDLDLQISEGEHIGLVGPSGCGKSTLLSIIAGLSAQSDGQISVFGEHEQQERLSYCSWMPQNDLLFPWLTVAQNVALPLTNRHVPKRKALQQSLPYLERFGLGEYANKPPYSMSGGMRQRASFVRTILTEKDILLLDEPFGALDSITRMDLQTWLHDTLITMNSTSVLVTHDVEEALVLSDRVVLMSKNPGRIVMEINGFFSCQLPHAALVAQDDFIRAREQIITALKAAQDPHGSGNSNGFPPAAESAVATAISTVPSTENATVSVAATKGGAQA